MINEYYHSEKWKNEKKAVFMRAMRNPKASMHGICEVCGYSPWKPCLKVYRVTKVALGDETLADLRLLCPRCAKKLCDWKMSQGKKGSGA